MNAELLLDICAPLPRYAPNFRHGGIPPHPDLVVGCPYVFMALPQAGMSAMAQPWLHSSHPNHPPYASSSPPKIILPPAVDALEQTPSPSLHHSLANLSFPQSPPFPPLLASKSSSLDAPSLPPRKRMRLFTGPGIYHSQSTAVDRLKRRRALAVGEKAVRHELPKQQQNVDPFLSPFRTLPPGASYHREKESPSLDAEKPGNFSDAFLPPQPLHPPSILTANVLVGNIRHPQRQSEWVPFPAHAPMVSEKDPCTHIDLPSISLHRGMTSSTYTFPPSWAVPGVNLKRRYDDIYGGVTTY